MAPGGGEHESQAECMKAKLSGPRACRALQLLSKEFGFSSKRINELPRV